LKEEGLLIKEEEYQTRLGFSQRTNAVVEPRISTQWFVKMRELADKALGAVVNGEVKIYPEERFLATYKYWLENVKDWCISRQLWWGQRIPAWYDEEGRFVVAETEKEAKEMFNAQYATTPVQLKQDEDVLDTWFSSWLWPVEVFHGITQPNNPDISYYYPTSVLVTGQDIIFFWVARMIMAGEEYMNQKPFDHVYFTGMVRDKQGRKMSKSLGNSPDLLDLIDRFGADAVRFGIMISAPAGNDLLFDDSSCEQGRNFNNKIWNALKLLKMWEGKLQTSNSKLQTNFAVDWFENRLKQVKGEVEEMYKQFRLSEALKTIYSLIWDDFCSWYLEWVKPGFEQAIDQSVYEKTVRFFTELMQLLHPFMPFVTEEIYHQLKERNDDLCIKQFSGVTKIDGPLLQQGELLKQTISAIRDARVKNNIKPKDVASLYIQTEEEKNFAAIESILSKQVNAQTIQFTKEPKPNAITVVVGAAKFFIETKNELDLTSQKEQLSKDLEYQKGFLVSVEKKLSNERFVQNAKPEVVEMEKRKKADAEQKIKALEESLASLNPSPKES
jgi:valyl-tRNA synthetase